MSIALGLPSGLAHSKHEVLPLRNKTEPPQCQRVNGLAGRRTVGVRETLRIAG